MDIVDSCLQALSCNNIKITINYPKVICTKQQTQVDFYNLGL